MNLPLVGSKIKIFENIFKRLDVHILQGIDLRWYLWGNMSCCYLLCPENGTLILCLISEAKVGVSHLVSVSLNIIKALTSMMHTSYD